LSKVTERGALTPSSVVKQYSSLVGGPVQAREIIALSLREGTLQARAAHRWISNDASLAQAWKNEPDKEQYPKPQLFSSSHQIKKTDWQKSVTCSDDVALWNFSRSRLHITISSSPPQRIMLRDVRFLIHDIRTIFEFTQTSSKSNFHRSNKIDQWRRFWHEIVIMAAQGKKTVKESQLKDFSTDAEVVSEVKRRIFLEDESRKIFGKSDIELAELIANRLTFKLSAHTIAQEVKILRQTFDLKRTYAKRGRDLGLTMIEKTGSAGRTK
jgi:hypothetical protein